MYFCLAPGLETDLAASIVNCSECGQVEGLVNTNTFKLRFNHDREGIAMVTLS